MVKKRLSKKNIRTKGTVSLSVLKPSIVPTRLSPFGIAYSSAILCAAFILALSLLAKYTIYGQTAVELIQPFFFTFSGLSAFGIISAMAEAAIHGLIFGFVFTWLYNKLA